MSSKNNNVCKNPLRIGVADFLFLYVFAVVEVGLGLTKYLVLM